MNFGLYGSGMHDFILREAEVGRRVAVAEDSESCGFGPMFDAVYADYLAGLDDEASDVV